VPEVFPLSVGLKFPRRFADALDMDGALMSRFLAPQNPIDPTRLGAAFALGSGGNSGGYFSGIMMNSPHLRAQAAVRGWSELFFNVFFTLTRASVHASSEESTRCLHGRKRGLKSCR